MAYARSAYTDKLDFYQRTTPHDLVAEFGSPLYVYNERILRARCRELRSLSRHAKFSVTYSVKANSNPALLKIIREEGLMADAMSPGELAMDFAAGYEPEQIYFISNNNTPTELLHAVSRGCLVSVDSLSQLETLGSLRQDIRVMARINPGIGEGHHAKVITGGSASKFGISPDKMNDIIAILDKYNLTLAGLNQHIGSLFMQPDNYLAACRALLQIVERLPENKFRQLEVIDFGGGFGIPYHKYDGEERLDMQALGMALHNLISDWAQKTSYNGRFSVEPGRYVVAECGILLGQVTAVKQTDYTRFVGTDIGFNVLMRPVLYDAWHDVEIYDKEGGGRKEETQQTIVGNICESGDILARDRILPTMRTGNILGILDAGAYGFSMASNYNERLLPAEALITESGDVKLIRRRQTIRDLEACLIGL